MDANEREWDFLDGIEREGWIRLMRLMLVVVSSLTLLLALWAGAARHVVEVPPGYVLMEAGREVDKLPEVDRGRIRPLIDQGRKNLEEKIEWLKAKFDAVFVAAFLIAAIGLVAGIRGPSKRV